MEQTSKSFEPHAYLCAALFAAFPLRKSRKRVNIKPDCLETDADDFFDMLVLATWQVATGRQHILETARVQDLVQQHRMRELAKALRGEVRSDPWENGFALVKSHVHTFFPVDCCQSLRSAAFWFELHNDGDEAIMRGRLQEFDPELRAFAEAVQVQLREYSTLDVLVAAQQAWWTPGLLLHH